MSARWVAGSVRARALPRRQLGSAGARQLAGSRTLDDAVTALARSPYGRFVRAGDTLGAAQRGVADTLLWNVRVLAGWVPGDGVRALRLLAGWFELANVDEHLRALTAAGQPVEPPFRLGTLATAWPRLAATTSPAELRDVLARSPWGDPGTDRPRELSLALRLSWADRVAAGVAPAGAWAAGAVALLVARTDPAQRRHLPQPALRAVDRLLGRAWPEASTVEELAGTVSPSAAWALRDVPEPADLWRAEIRWWARVRADGARLLADPGFGPHAAVGAAALLAVDAWQTRAALEATARVDGGGWSDVSEVFGALA
ncbi:hypothetical protein ACNTMW_24930 [Planosporangium sp. 12N6]|uniref:hypothetical protein n=1 Tax=Planosporangium spinosum TaxID=3402278 RepID=UPI003CF2E6EF